MHSESPHTGTCIVQSAVKDMACFYLVFKACRQVFPWTTPLYPPSLPFTFRFWSASLNTALLYCLHFFFSPGVWWCSHCVIRLPFTCTNCGLDKLTSSEVRYQWNLILTKTHMHTTTHRGRPCPILRVIPPLALCVFCFVLSAGFQEISPPSRFGQTGWPI